MNASLAMTTFRLPRSLLADLKARAAREHKSLNRFLLEMAEDRLRVPRPEKRQRDPLFLIGTDPWQDGPSDLAERHDDYLYGPVTYQPDKPSK